MANYGLNTLMECIKQSESTQANNDKLFALFEATNIDDDVASKITGDNYELEDEEDSVEKDMSGHGIGYKDEEKLKKLIDKIPEDDSEDLDIDDEEISQVIESVLGNIDNIQI